MSEKYLVKYEDGDVNIRQFKVIEAIKYSKLSKLLRHPINREEVQFQLIVDTFKEMIETDVQIEELDLMAFRELCIMVNGYSSKDSGTNYKFKCENTKMINLSKEAKKDLYRVIMDKNGGTEESEEAREVRISYEELPDYVSCEHTITGSIPFSKVKGDIEYLLGREVMTENSMPVYSYTVGHRILLDKLECTIPKGQMVTLDNMSVTDDISKVDWRELSNDNCTQKIVFDFVKIALHLLPFEELSENKVWDKYNYLNDLTIEDFRDITDKIKEEFDFEPKTVEVNCDNCGAGYKLLVNIEDVRLVPN